MDPRVSVQHEDFSVDDVYRQIRDELGATVGAIASFVGLVRDHNMHGQTHAVSDGPVRDEATSPEPTVATLTLEHYPGMTEPSIGRILDEAENRWPLLATRVIHRVGELAPTDQIVLVMVASAHRDAAFAGAEFVMDYLKTDAVFWKKERNDQGQHWIQSTRADLQRRKDWDKTAG